MFNDEYSIDALTIGDLRNLIREEVRAALQPVPSIADRIAQRDRGDVGDRGVHGSLFRALVNLGVSPGIVRTAIRDAYPTDDEVKARKNRPIREDEQPVGTFWPRYAAYLDTIVKHDPNQDGA